MTPIYKQTLTHREQGLKWELPKLLAFESLDGKYRDAFNPNHATYKVLGYREPKKGEYYVSGAKPMAYKAPNDLGLTYLVVEPLVTYKRQTVTNWFPI